jgi:hypothetical protein
LGRISYLGDLFKKRSILAILNSKQKKIDELGF